MDAYVNSFIERGARWLKPDLKNGIALERFAPRVMHVSQRLACQQTYFQGPHQLLAIVWGDAPGGRRIKPPQHCVQVSIPTARATCVESPTQLLGTSWSFGQPFKQCAQVEAGANGEDWQRAPLPQGREQFESAAAVFTGGKWFRRGLGAINQIHHMVNDAAPFLHRGFGRSDVKTAVDLRRIAGDDFAPEPFR